MGMSKRKQSHSAQPSQVVRASRDEFDIEKVLKLSQVDSPKNFKSRGGYSFTEFCFNKSSFEETEKGDQVLVNLLTKCEEQTPTKVKRLKKKHGKEKEALENNLENSKSFLFSAKKDKKKHTTPEKYNDDYIHCDGIFTGDEGQAQDSLYHKSYNVNTKPMDADQGYIFSCKSTRGLNSSASSISWAEDAIESNFTEKLANLWSDIELACETGVKPQGMSEATHQECLRWREAFPHQDPIKMKNLIQSDEVSTKPSEEIAVLEGTGSWPETPELSPMSDSRLEGCATPLLLRMTDGQFVQEWVEECKHQNFSDTPPLHHNARTSDGNGKVVESAIRRPDPTNFFTSMALTEADNKCSQSPVRFCTSAQSSRDGDDEYEEEDSFKSLKVYPSCRPLKVQRPISSKARGHTYTPLPVHSNSFHYRNDNNEKKKNSDSRKEVDFIGLRSYQDVEKDLSQFFNIPCRLGTSKQDKTSAFFQEKAAEKDGYRASTCISSLSTYHKAYEEDLSYSMPADQESLKCNPCNFGLKDQPECSNQNFDRYSISEVPTGGSAVTPESQSSFPFGRTSDERLALSASKHEKPSNPFFSWLVDRLTPHDE